MLKSATFAGETENGARFSLDDGWECRIYILRDDLLRVLFTPPGGLRELRTWSIVTEGTDVPWTGRDRFDVRGFPCPAFSLESGGGNVTLATGTVIAKVRLSPFGIAWSLSDGTLFASDRDTNAYQWRSATRTVRHYMTRNRDGDRYFAHSGSLAGYTAYFL